MVLLSAQRMDAAAAAKVAFTGEAGSRAHPRLSSVMVNFMTDEPSQSPKPLTSAQRAKLKAIVLDTNSMGKGHLNLKTLAEWAQRCQDNDLELWLPEVVLAEWAEHAAEQFTLAHDAASDSRRWLRHVGIESTWPVQEPGDVIEHVLMKVRAIPGVTVIPLHHEDAKEAVLDQILLRSPGERRNKVKTGAADSAWVRSVHRMAEGDLDSVLVVCGDVKAMQLCKRLGWAVPLVVPRLFDVPRLLQLYERASIAQAWQLCEAISAELPTDFFSPPYVLEFGEIDLGELREAVTQHIDDELVDFIQDVGLLSIDELAGVGEVLVAKDDATFLAEIHFLGTASVQTAGFDNDGAPQYAEEQIANLHLRVRAEVFVVNGRVERFASDGDPVHVDAHDEGARSALNGLQYSRTALDILPGVGDGHFPPPEGGVRILTVHGHDVRLYCEVDEPGWILSSYIDNNVVAYLSCQPSRRAFGWQAFDFSIEPLPASSPNPVWLFAAWTLQAIQHD